MTLKEKVIASGVPFEGAALECVEEYPELNVTSAGAQCLGKTCEECWDQEFEEV